MIATTLNPGDSVRLIGHRATYEVHELRWGPDGLEVVVWGGPTMRERWRVLRAEQLRKVEA